MFSTSLLRRIQQSRSGPYIHIRFLTLQPLVHLDRVVVVSRNQQLLVTEQSGLVASPDVWASGEIEAGKELLKKYAGRIADAGDQAMGPIGGQGGGGVTGWEDFVFYDPYDPDSAKAATEISDEGDKLKIAQGRPPGGMLLGLARSTHADPEIRAQKLSKSPEYHWQRKLKALLDPNGVGSGNYFWGAEPSKEEKK